MVTSSQSQVLQRNNIQVLSIHGKHKQRERMATLEKFKSSGHDGPRVLLVSNVGSVGLNIAFANILVIVVCGQSTLHAPFYLSAMTFVVGRSLVCFKRSTTHRASMETTPRKARARLSLDWGEITRRALEQFVI